MGRKVAEFCGCGIPMSPPGDAKISARFRAAREDGKSTDFCGRCSSARQFQFSRRRDNLSYFEAAWLASAADCERPA